MQQAISALPLPVSAQRRAAGSSVLRGRAGKAGSALGRHAVRESQWHAVQGHCQLFLPSLFERERATSGPRQQGAYFGGAGGASCTCSAKLQRGCERSGAHLGPGYAAIPSAVGTGAGTFSRQGGMLRVGQDGLQPRLAGKVAGPASEPMRHAQRSRNYGGTPRTAPHPILAQQPIGHQHFRLSLYSEWSKSRSAPCRHPKSRAIFTTSPPLHRRLPLAPRATCAQYELVSAALGGAVCREAPDRRPLLHVALCRGEVS